MLSSFLFGKGKQGQGEDKKVYKAHMGSSLAMVYNEELRCWVEPGKEEEMRAKLAADAAAKSVPPPKGMAAPFVNKPPPSNSSSVSGTSGPPRGRMYVDAYKEMGFSTGGGPAGAPPPGPLLPSPPPLLPPAGAIIHNGPSITSDSPRQALSPIKVWVPPVPPANVVKASTSPTGQIDSEFAREGATASTSLTPDIDKDAAMVAAQDSQSTLPELPISAEMGSTNIRSSPFDIPSHRQQPYKDRHQPIYEPIERLQGQHDFQQLPQHQVPNQHGQNMQQQLWQNPSQSLSINGTSPPPSAPAEVPKDFEAEIAKLRRELAAVEEAKNREIEALKAQLAKGAATTTTVVDHSPSPAAVTRMTTDIVTLSTSSQQSHVEEPYELPNFIWNCGNDKILDFVQRLLSDNASLRNQIVSVSTGGSGRMPTDDEEVLSLETDGSSDGFIATLYRIKGNGDNGSVMDIKAAVSVSSDAIVANSASRKIFCEALESATITEGDLRKAALPAIPVLRHCVDMECAAVTSRTDCAVTVASALGALWNLTFTGEESGTLDIAALIDSTLNAMRLFGNNLSVQSCGAGLLVNLTTEQSGLRYLCSLRGSIDCLIDATLHKGDESILEHVCQILAVVATRRELRSSLTPRCADVAKRATAPQAGLSVQKWGQWLSEQLSK